MKGTPEEILAQQVAKVAARAAEAVPPMARPHPTLMFPYDDSQTMIAALRTARLEVEHVLKGIITLELLYGVEPPAPEAESQDALRQAREAEGDRRAAERGMSLTVAPRAPRSDQATRPTGKEWKNR